MTGTFLASLRAMETIRKILVPVDDSPATTAAIGVACDYARRHRAAITLLHVSEPPIHPVPETGLPALGTWSGFASAARATVERIRSRVAATCGGLDVRTVSVVGRPIHEILELAEEDGFDLVIMGTHARKGFQRFLHGSIAEAVVRRCVAPVLVVRERRQAMRAYPGDERRVAAVMP